VTRCSSAAGKIGSGRRAAISIHEVERQRVALPSVGLAASRNLSVHARRYSVSRILSSVPGPPLDRCFFLRQVANPFVDVGVN